MVNDKILYDSCKTFNIDASSAQSLIESGANPLYEYDGETPLKAYVTKKNNNIKNDVVILLLSSVDYKNINDFDIFEYLCSDNIDIDLLKLLISKGIEINNIKKNGINIVEKYATTSNPNIDVFKLLLDKGIPTCSNIQYGYKIKIEQIRRAGEYYNWDDELDDYDYTTDYDDRMGKTVLYYYIITRSQDGYATSLDVINYLISHEKEMRYYTYREHTTLYYYLDKCDIKREIFDALFDSNYSGHELMNILSNYLRKQFRKKNHKIDNYIVDQLLFDRDTFYILELCNSLRNNILISTILKRYTDSIQDLLLEYVSYHTVYINVIKCMIDEGATLYRFKHINKYFQKFGNRDPKVVEYILKNGNLVVDNDNDDNLINIMPLFPTFSMRELDVLSILKLCKPYIDDINKIDKHGCSILYHCIESHSVSLVEWLIDNGADINIITKYGFTCIGICVIMAHACIPEIAEIYIKILEIILSKLPTIECIKKTVDYLSNDRHLLIGNKAKSLLKICIKYFILVDYKYTCDTYPSYIEYITDCEKEIADMRQIKINGMDILTIMYKLNKHTKKRYVNNPIFTDWANKQYKFYNQIIYNANKLIEQSKKIDNMIDEVSADNNRLSTLPLELRHLIFSYAFL
ncbi:CPXV027 protein [Cowpox virus]|uniref:CPXV027 protein n=1 Tax=Cowpox virus TaxID=10243 RepID=U5TFC0_COWPX|nr:CPXV027 protein [Cowpox virus]AGY98334.1 CPXV027 protein [Cowpox virus]AGY98551.1 CPXV027 protein [Cowpox virus]AGY98988.1 CPXV027 protein [Cowpox virus]AGY99829.1 CPXV027 protein [Cowpox virus]